MSTAEIQLPAEVLADKNYFRADQWSEFRKEKQRFRVRVHLSKEADEGFTAFCPDLDGVISEGDDLSSAIENLKEAFSGCVEEYKAEGKSIPWNTSREKAKEGITERWITVDV